MAEFGKGQGKGKGQCKGQGGGYGGDHAGGGGSEMLSSALITAHDGIVGYWDGQPLRNPPPFGKSDVDISYLSAEVRGDLLDSILTPNFAVSGTDGTATLASQGHPIVALNRPERAIFRQQLAMVRAYADLRDDRLPEILEQTEDLLSFFGAVAFLDADRHGKTLELLAAVMARLMTGLGPKSALGGTGDPAVIATMPFRVAHRIATNRSVAGVHFPVDSAAGAVVGCVLGETAYRIATGRDAIDWPQPVEVTFGALADNDPPFDLTMAWLRDILVDDAPELPTTDDILGTLWKAAAAEWVEEPL